MANDRNNIGQFTKGHSGFYKAKKIDAEKFLDGYELWIKGELSMTKYCKLVGVSFQTLQKHLRELLVDGYVPGYVFTDGKPMSITKEARERQLKF